MHAIEVSVHGGPEVLRYVEKPEPSPGPGELLIKAEAIGVNYADTYFRTGAYHVRRRSSRAPRFCGTVASLAVRGTLALFGASSGPVPPVDPQGLNSAGSVYLTRPTLVHYTRTRDEFAWCAGELLDSIGNKVLDIRVSGTYPLAKAARAHTDLHSRKTTGAIVLLP
jgi:NADPH:quinone reductase-like Zn-dependent oxidoreductase